MKSVPRGKAIWNANGGYVSVLLTHLFLKFCMSALILVILLIFSLQIITNYGEPGEVHAVHNNKTA